MEECMTLHTSAAKLRANARLITTCALMLGALACDGRYSHGRIAVDAETRRRWDAGEREIEKAGKAITPISPDKSSPEQVPVRDLAALLSHVDSSARHGAGDKRVLSLVDSGRVRSSNILAEVILVNGSEYKAEKDFQAGWIPVAIIYRPPTKEPSSNPYEKLSLSDAPVSWIFAREVSSSKWIGSLVHVQGDRYVQSPLDITINDADHVEPVLGARFVWRDDDEIIWTYCGGKCCQVKGVK
jgi:hypothetical protein